MSKDIWVSSDWHLNHANFLNFTDDKGNKIRPFSNVNEMNECILDNHNSLVKKGDKFWTLGDVFFGDKEWFKSNIVKFNGSKRLIVGNHDDIKFLSCGGFFQKVHMWRVWEDMLFSHVPVHESGLMNYKNGEIRVNVHGHIHNNESPPGPYLNVCVEKTNYFPINLEELRDRSRKLLKSLETKSE